MILHRIPVYIALVLCLLTIYGLFTVKDNVMSLRFELQEVRKQVQNEEDAIRILKAELAYLGSPERIQKLASDYLNLEKPKAAQMIKDPLIAGNISGTKQLASIQTNKKPVKWRYKKGPSKYVMARGEK
jgi:cell division protein FtsL